MSLVGQGALLIWHDLLPEAKEEFYRWHNREHIPERLSIRGFRSGRRYRAISAGPEFFVLYEVETIGALTGADYRDRLNSPTDWTRRMLPSFRNTSRAICRTVYTSGSGVGGCMATYRFAMSNRARQQMVRELCDRILPVLADLTGIAGAHLCASDEAVSQAATVEKTLRDAPDQIPAWTVLIEGVSAAQVNEARNVFRAHAALNGPELDGDLYQLEHICSNIIA